jgi:hypothetical protein
MHYLFQDIIKMSIFSHFKTENPMVNAILSTLFIGIGTYLYQTIFDFRFRRFSIYDLPDFIASWIYRKHSIAFEGKHNCVLPKFEIAPIISVCFSDAFKALLFDIIEGVDGNYSIYEIKEYITSKRFSEKLEDMYIISQRSRFLYNAPLEIYAILDSYVEESESEKKTSSVKTDTITITLYSYKTNIQGIKDLVEEKKQKYLKHIEALRHDKKFIYSLCKPSSDESRFECWKEYPFESAKRFDNIFFEGKAEVVEKVRFFLENKDWYYKNGIPYTLGIGLSGEPGTGKTSFFKCLANMTGRHLVVLSFKIIKTKTDLERFFMEDRYNENNKAHDIGFDKKIIVIEDIDCMGDIVMDRSLIEKRKQKKEAKKKTPVEQIIEYNENTCDKMVKQMEDDIVTLDDILNLWDGLNETPGRILGISSNHYDKLDPALVRPGRIDITLKMEKATRNTISKMFEFHYGKKINMSKLKKIKDRHFSPAQIINTYVSNKEDPEGFYKDLTC